MQCESSGCVGDGMREHLNLVVMQVINLWFVWFSVKSLPTRWKNTNSPAHVGASTATNLLSASRFD